MDDGVGSERCGVDDGGIRNGGCDINTEDSGISEVCTFFLSSKNLSQILLSYLLVNHIIARIGCSGRC